MSKEIRMIKCRIAERGRNIESRNSQPKANIEYMRFGFSGPTCPFAFLLWGASVFLVVVQLFTEQHPVGWPRRPGRAAGSRSDKKLLHTRSIVSARAQGQPGIERTPSNCIRMARLLVASRPDRCYARGRATQVRTYHQKMDAPPTHA